MTARVLWVPGVFPSTNQALKLARDEGAWFSRNGWRSKPPAEGYSWWARHARQTAELHARSARIMPVLPDERVDVEIGLVYHPHYDGDAWTMPGKWFLDGLCDAGILLSDRRNVRHVGGRCFATNEEGAAFLASRGQPLLRRPGALIELAEVRS